MFRFLKDLKIEHIAAAVVAGLFLYFGGGAAIVAGVSMVVKAVVKVVAYVVAIYAFLYIGYALASVYNSKNNADNGIVFAWLNSSK